MDLFISTIEGAFSFLLAFYIVLLNDAPWLVVVAACAACAMKTEPARGEMRRLRRFPRIHYYFYFKQKGGDVRSSFA